MGLAWRRGVDRIEVPETMSQPPLELGARRMLMPAAINDVLAHCERVGLVELERVVRLRRDVDAHDVEAGAGISRTGSPGTTEQVEQPQTFSHARHHWCSLQ
jgi:hypothetical protein